jgi:cobalt-zinc-cadmium efflux system membrane fusion protein
VLATAAPLACNSGSDAETSERHEERGDEHADEHAQGEEGHAHGEGDEEHHDEGLVRLTPEQRETAGIASTPAGPGVIDAGVELLGEIRPNGDQLAHIFPRFPGLALEVRKSAGDAVRAGDVLALMESSETLSTYPMKTLIDGVVLEKELTRGEAVERDKLCFVVANLATVWLELSVYPRDLARVRVGQQVLVAPGEQAASEHASISYLTPSIDSRTRTATARVVLDNAKGQWRPGMFVSVRVVEDEAAEIAIPRGALQVVEGKPSVFVETDEGWALRAVQPGREGNQMVEVLSGLVAGERVASTHTFLLKSELGKGEAGHHDH